jgi:hypothetical protein
MAERSRIFYKRMYLCVYTAVKPEKMRHKGKNHLIIYSDDEFIIQLINPLNRQAKEGNLFKCFFGQPDKPFNQTFD